MNFVDKVIGSSEDIVIYAKKNAPKLLSIGSSVLAAGACAGTGIATWKAKERIEEHNDNISCLHDKLACADNEKDREVLKRDILCEYGKTGLTILGYYSIPATMLAGSIACDIASSKEYEHKLAIASGSLFLLKTAWDKAQERAKEELGEEKAADIFYGTKETEVVKIDKKGKEKIEKVKTYDPYGIVFSNPCAILLGEGIDSNLTDNRWYDISLIKSIEEKYTYNLNKDGFVFVNDIYKDLGVLPASKYQHDLWTQYGWVKDKKKIDNYIAKCKAEGTEIKDEGIINANAIRLGLDNFVNEKYIAGDEPMVWIIPNCIGDITPFIFPDGQLEKAITS